MMNFNVYFGNTSNTIISILNSQTIFELKAMIISAIDAEFEDVNIYLEKYGILDDTETLELPLEILGLNSINKFYTLFIINNKQPEMLWRVLCSEKIIGKIPITQQGFIIDDKKGRPVCLKCRLICHSDKQVKESPLLENNFYCMCGDNCLFSQCEINNKKLAMQNINSILVHHAEEFCKREKARIDEISKEVMGRTFEFEKSIQFGLQRVMMYKTKSVSEKVLSVVPIEELKKEAETNAKISKLDTRDELVKSLLSWFKYKFFSWCNKARCSICQQESDVYVATEKPNDEEQKWLASRTEVYKCSKCNTLNRFARYNNPAKLCETRTGRCGEYANLFGCILANFDYEVRFVDNFEDHVWNEYYSISLSRWVHVDSCENAWDTPLLYEQGWGRNMTFLLGHSVTGIYDVSRRYVKDWNLIAARRRHSEIDRLNKLIETQNNILRENVQPDLIELLYIRDMTEQMELLKVKSVQEAEMIGRQSGDEEWRKQRGEIK